MTTMTLVGAKSRPMVHGSNPTLLRDSFVSCAKGSSEEKPPHHHHPPTCQPHLVLYKNTARTVDVATEDSGQGAAVCTCGVLAFRRTFVSLQSTKITQLGVSTAAALFHATSDFGGKNNAYNVYGTSSYVSGSGSRLL